MGIAGALIVLAQVASNFGSSHGVSNDIAKLRSDMKRVQVNQEQYFVKKKDFKKVVVKLDTLNSHVLQLSQQIKSIRNNYAFGSFKTNGG